jgi:Secretion system C-terminal sorting domain
MKKILFLFFISLFISQLQGQAVKFNKLIDVQEDLWLEDAVETSSGEFIIVGASKLVGISDYLHDHPIFCKLDANGNLLHYEILPFNGSFSTILTTSDNNYVIGGWKLDSLGGSQIYLLKMDQNFNVIKDTTWGRDTLNESIIKMNESHNQGLIISGTFQRQAGGSLDLYYAEMQDFTLIKENYIVLNSTQYPSEVVKNADGEGYYTSVLVSPANTLPGYHPNAIVRLNKDLELGVYTVFDTLRNESGTGFYEYHRPISMDKGNDNLLIGGMSSLYKTSSCSMGTNGTWRCEQLRFGVYDTMGAIIQEHFFGRPNSTEFEALQGLDYLYPNHIYATATTNFKYFVPHYFADTTNEILVAKINANGDSLWQRFYGGDAYYGALKILATRDSGALILAWRYDLDNPIYQHDGYVLKIDKNGGASTAISPNITESNIHVYPNPANDKITVRVNNKTSQLDWEIYNLHGQKVANGHGLGNTLDIDVSTFCRGIYLIKVK